MKLSYKGNSAIITGASGGMGLEISKKLSQNNISVLMLDLKNPSNDFLKKNVNCEFKKVDVTNLKSMKTHIDKFYKKNNRVDYLVNTTGVLWFDKDISAVNIDDKIWDKVFKINLIFFSFAIIDVWSEILGECRFILFNFLTFNLLKQCLKNLILFLIDCLIILSTVFNPALCPAFLEFLCFNPHLPLPSIIMAT